MPSANSASTQIASAEAMARATADSRTTRRARAGGRAVVVLLNIKVDIAYLSGKRGRLRKRIVRSPVILVFIMSMLSKFPDVKP
jgi:hypothetical protein